jgi:transposase
LEELAQLGRTLWRRRADITTYFDHRAFNGPNEAINGASKPCAETRSNSAT